jgi:adenine-specific DNA-methyltransferase
MSIQNFTNRVILGDCVRILPELPGGSIDLVLTDPPYLAHYRDRAGRTIAGDVEGSWLVPAFQQIFRVLKPDRFCVCFYGWHKADQFFSAWRGAGFSPVGHLVWTKSYASSERYLRYHHEQAYLLAKGNPQKPASRLADVLEWRYTGDLLHPTEKPVSALLPLVQTFTQQNQIVLDPFCGSGSTLLAARLLHRRYVGIELSSKFCETARRRL